MKKVSPRPTIREAAVDDPSAAFELREAIQRFVRTFGLLASDVTPCGTPLATTHAHALMVLLRLVPTTASASGVTHQVLGKALGIDKSNVTRLCAKMEREGHVTQRPSPADGRSRLVSLTVRGTRLAESVDRASVTRFASVLAAVPVEQRATLLGALDALNGAVEVTRDHGEG